MSKTHTWDKSKYPSCNSDKYKYMREMDYINKENVNFIKNKIKSKKEIKE